MDSKKMNECQGKQPFKSQQEANKMVANINGKKKKKVRSYKCSSCGLYHFGHENKRKKANKRFKDQISATYSGTSLKVIDDSINL